MEYSQTELYISEDTARPFAIVVTHSEGYPMSIEQNGEPIVTIRSSGEIEVNPRYSTTEAAQVFWYAVRELQRKSLAGAALLQAES